MTTTFNKIDASGKFFFRDKEYVKVAEKHITRKVKAGMMYYNAISFLHEGTDKARTNYHLFIGGQRVEA